MGIFGKLIQAGIKTAALPLSVGQDILTMAGGASPEATKENLSEIKNKLKKAYDSLDED